jgi:catechol 2,3-dioxygenase-like lactoylglutathione lyase family enzyme
VVGALPSYVLRGGKGVTIRRRDHAGILADDLEAATAFFLELGLTRSTPLGPGRRRARAGEHPGPSHVLFADEGIYRLCYVRGPDS